MRRSISLFFLLAPLAFGQSARSVTTPYHAPASVNFYIATGGSDSNPCTSASKCLTLAHALLLVPQTLDNNYTINVADGTYAEPINPSGFIGTGMYAGGRNTQLQILGNTTTPANVVFSGTVACTAEDTRDSFLSGACISGSANVKLNGLTITNGQRNGIACYNGNLELAKTVVTMTGGSGAASVGFDGLTCHALITDNVTVSGFDTTTSPTGGLGFYVGRLSQISFLAGTLTVTGPGTGSSMSADGTIGIVVENEANFVVAALGTIATISGVQSGINLAANSSFSQFAGGMTMNISNGSTTPTSSIGVQVNNGSTFDWLSGTISIDHYSVCLQATVNSEAASSATTANFTNCTAHVTATGGQIVGF
ncbi:MAG: hypothetical protein V4502_08085 [Pseudomonadota bacterium]